MLGLNDYQTYAARTLDQSSGAEARERQLAVLALGLGGEAGEVQELVKKNLGHGHDLDRERVMKELGDVLWYVAGVGTHLGISLEDIAQENLAKLRKRYPDGFDPERSKNRGDL
jgi:NTP pyrophosphatase (non-canonical NTP hydrolase)